MFLIFNWLKWGFQGNIKNHIIHSVRWICSFQQLSWNHFINSMAFELPSLIVHINLAKWLLSVFFTSGKARSCTLILWYFVSNCALNVCMCILSIFRLENQLKLKSWWNEGKAKRAKTKKINKRIITDKHRYNSCNIGNNQNKTHKCQRQFKRNAHTQE